MKTSSSLAPVPHPLLEHSSAALRGNWRLVPNLSCPQLQFLRYTWARWLWEECLWGVQGVWQKHRWCHTKPVTFRHWAPQSCTHCRDAAGRFWHWNRSVCGKMPYIWPGRRKENTLSGGIKDTAPRSILHLSKLKLSSTWLDTMSNCWDWELGTGLEKILKS